MIIIKTEELNKYINELLNKSEEAYLMSIEIINKPTINYRTEGFCFFICNAWELLLKAYLINKAKDKIFGLIFFLAYFYFASFATVAPGIY